MGRLVLISAAEVSGDVLGAALARELLTLDPALTLAGLGGPRMAASGVEVLADITHTSIVGFFDGTRHLPSYLRANRAVRRALAGRSPAAVVAIDAPGFNFPLLDAARRRGIPTIYYVCPQTWWWNPDGAAARLRRAAAHAVAVVPDEAALYRAHGLPTIHHGHPIVDLVECAPRDPQDRPGERGDGPIPIGLLPGSRRHETARLLPLMCDAMRLAAAALGPIDIRVGVPSEPWPDSADAARRLAGRGIRVTMAHAHEVLRQSRVTLAASGIVLLEACLLDAPVVMTYRIDRASYWIAHHVLRLHEKLPHLALPNLLARERVVPERVQRDATAGGLAEEICRLARDGDARRRMREGYRRVRAALGQKGVTRAIARDMLDIVAASSG